MTNGRKIPLVSLENMSFQKSQGRVGLHNLKHRNKAFGGKLIWKLYTNPASKWCHASQIFGQQSTL